MQKIAWGVVLFSVSWLLPGHSFAATPMKPGLWEVNTTVEIRGMPFQPPPQTMRHCYTEQDVKESPVPKEDNCKIHDVKSSGNRTTWKMECSGEAASQGEGEIIHQGDSAYQGRTRMQSQGMMMDVRYRGKRIGECK